MYTLYQDLESASQYGRGEIATNLVHGLLSGDPNANLDYWFMADHVLRNEVSSGIPERNSSTHGAFSAVQTCDLLRSVPRVSGFVQAIDRAPQAESAIDAGCGSSAVLAVATAVLHPQAEIIAYEVNPKAARCAQLIVELFGLHRRISIETANVLSIKLPRVDLAVTETFGPALLWESGPRITNVLGKVATTVIPSISEIFAYDEPTDPLDESPGNWRHAGTVHLTDHSNTITGKFASNGAGLRRLLVYSNFYDEKHEPVVAGRRQDKITAPDAIGALEVAEPGQLINFRYRIGVDRKDSYPRIWAQKAVA